MESRLTASGKSGQGVKGLSKKDQGLMDMDNSEEPFILRNNRDY